LSKALTPDEAMLAAVRSGSQPFDQVAIELMLRVEARKSEKR
jgi:hypothetical protein